MPRRKTASTQDALVTAAKHRKDELDRLIASMGDYEAERTRIVAFLSGYEPTPRKDTAHRAAKRGARRRTVPNKKPDGPTDAIIRVVGAHADGLPFMDVVRQVIAIGVHTDAKDKEKSIGNRLVSLAKKGDRVQRKNGVYVLAG